MLSPKVVLRRLRHHIQNHWSLWRKRANCYGPVIEFCRWRIDARSGLAWTTRAASWQIESLFDVCLGRIESSFYRHQRPSVKRFLCNFVCYHRDFFYLAITAV